MLVSSFKYSVQAVFCILIIGGIWVAIPIIGIILGTATAGIFIYSAIKHYNK